jgi:AraC-like DNA-binding protein/CheY-like chemotaxis protein
MHQPLILWMNLARNSGTPALCRRLENHCRVQRCTDPDALAGLMDTLTPDVICFDFAIPFASERALIQRCRLDYPSTPVLMFTTSDSAELMVWALRTRVWDCFIKPVSCGEVVRRLNILLPVLGGGSGQRARKLLMPERGAFAVPGVNGAEAGAARTSAVLPYLQGHFHEKIAVSHLARMCGMDAFEFSRCFRREQGVTFRDYLMRMRIDAAARRLRRDDRSVLDVACSVGFNDPSHFARLFRRHMGVTPRVYRNGHEVASPCRPAAGQELVAGWQGVAVPQIDASA